MPQRTACPGRNGSLRYAVRIDDIRYALRWAFTAARVTGDLAIRLAVAAIPFGKQMSLVEECRVAVEMALDDRWRDHRSVRDDLLLNLTLGATLLHTRGPVAEVKSSLTKALAIAGQLGDTDMELECLRGLSEYELWTGDFRSAIAVAEKIRELETRGQPAAAGDADAQAGSALSWMGALAASRHRLEGIVRRPMGRNLRPDAARFEFDQRLTARGALATVLWLQGLPGPGAGDGAAPTRGGRGVQLRGVALLRAAPRLGDHRPLSSRLRSRRPLP